MFSVIAFADGFDNVLYKINDKIVNPVIELSFIIALVVFLWGVFQFIRKAQSSTDREIGKQHMVWGLLGLLIMFSVYGVINLLIVTFGIDGPVINETQQTFDPPTIQDVQLPNFTSGTTK